MPASLQRLSSPASGCALQMGGMAHLHFWFWVREAASVLHVRGEWPTRQSKRNLSRRHSLQVAVQRDAPLEEGATPHKMKNCTSLTLHRILPCRLGELCTVEPVGHKISQSEGTSLRG